MMHIIYDNMTYSVLTFYVTLLFIYYVYMYIYSSIYSIFIQLILEILSIQYLNVTNIHKK